MKSLYSGLQRFREGPYTERKELFDKLATGQSPEVLFICCSDSRVAPTLFTQTEPGDLFVIRNAGNLVPAPEDDVPITATVEYAVSALKVKLAVVCGHSGCGAVGAALAPDTTEGLPAVRRLLSMVDAGSEGADGGLDAAVEANVRRQLANLRRHPSAAAAIERGDLRLQGWVYDIPSGGVRILDDEGDSFLPLESWLEGPGREWSSA
jgi:carbonic anhydrase